MTNPDYFQHEAQYRHLRMNGLFGWGGKSLVKRMQGWHATTAALFSSELFPSVGARLLELGSGAGDSLIPFAKRGYQVTGIEISPTAIQWAQEKFNTLALKHNFILGNVAEPLPFLDASFDAVLDATCIHCLVEHDRHKVLREAWRVLKPGGFLLISHMVNEPRELDEKMIFNPITRSQERAGKHYRSMPTYDQLIEELRSRGLEIAKQSLRKNAWWDHAELWCKKPI